MFVGPEDWESTQYVVRSAMRYAHSINQSICEPTAFHCQALECMLLHVARCDVLPQPFIIISPFNLSDMQQFLKHSEISHLHFLGRVSINEQGSEKSATIDCYRSECKGENTPCTCNNNQQRKQQQLTVREQEDLLREST